MITNDWPPPLRHMRLVQEGRIAELPRLARHHQSASLPDREPHGIQDSPGRADDVTERS